VKVDKKVTTRNNGEYNPPVRIRPLVFLEECHAVSSPSDITIAVSFSIDKPRTSTLDEIDPRPLSLCPVCLRKLHFSIGFDVVDRYQALSEFYRDVGFDLEARWLSRRLKCILDDDAIQ